MADSFNLFGFEIRRRKEKQKEQRASVVPPLESDGAALHNSAAAHYGLAVNVGDTSTDENELINKYREVACYSDCDKAVDYIVNEAIILDSDELPVALNLEQTKLSDQIKTKIQEEFEGVLRLLKFDEMGYDHFRQWYIDGRIFFYIILDKDIKKGIQELRLVDPKKIRKIKKLKTTKNEDGVEIIKTVDEFYIYNDKGIKSDDLNGIRLTTDSVIYVPSGLIDYNNNTVLSYLHKAIRPVNQLRMMEDALVIYRFSRAPERRVFYIDTGNLPKQRAEQYVYDMMNKFRNKIVYNASTGEVQEDRQHLSMMEDFWMPRREGGKGTEITTLDGGRNLGDIEDIEYFQKKLYQSMNVPISRLQSDETFNLARSGDITRDEVAFSKFISRIRTKFAHIFKSALRVQLITRGVMKESEWVEIEERVKFDFQQDNYFAELKEVEILNNRIDVLNNLDAFVGKYYSTAWVRRTILKQTEEEIKDMESEMAQDLEGADDEESY